MQNVKRQEKWKPVKDFDEAVFLQDQMLLADLVPTPAHDLSKNVIHTAINNIESESGNLIKSESGNLIESESGNLIESESPENAGTKNSPTALRQHIKNRPDQPHLERSKLVIVNSKDGKYVSLETFLPASKPMVTAGFMWHPDMCPGQKVMIV